METESVIDRPDDEVRSIVNKRKFNTIFKEGEATGYRELYIEPASYILDDDRHTFLPPSKALILGLLPFVSAGVFYYSGMIDDDQQPSVAHVWSKEKAIERAKAADVVSAVNDVGRDDIEGSIKRALLDPIQVVTPQHEMVSVAYRKPLVEIGAKGFPSSSIEPKPLVHQVNGRNTNKTVIKKELAKQVSLAMQKPLLKPLVLSTIKQARRVGAANISTVRLVSTKPKPQSKTTKTVVPMGILKLRSRLMDKQGRSVRASYFVVQQGKRIKQQAKATSALFKLPVGEYTIQSFYKGKMMQKKVLIEKAHVDKLTFVYADKDNQQDKPYATKQVKKAVGTGKIVVMAHDEQGKGNVLKTDYFVYKNGKEVLHKKNSSIINFKLPAGDYVLRAIHSSHKHKDGVFIRDMKIAVKPNSTVFPVFVFDDKDQLEKTSQLINANDLKIPAELLLHNDGYDEYASSDHLEVLPKLGLPTGIGYVRKNL